MEKMLLVPCSLEELRQVFQQEVHLLLDAHGGGTNTGQHDLLSTQQACQLLHLSKSSLYGLVHRKAIPYMKQGKRLFFSQKELMAWMATKRQATHEELEAKAATYLQKYSNRH